MKKPLLKLNFPNFPEINFAYQRVVSYSQFNLFQQCPHKWYLTHFERKKSPPNLNLIFGTSMHFVLQHYMQVMYTKSSAEADRIDIEKLFEDKYAEEYEKEFEANNKQHLATITEVREFYEDGAQILKWFKSHKKQYFTARNCSLIGIEVPLQTELKKNLIFIGYIDLVIYDKDLDKITIYDFKTSTRGWSKEAKKDDNKLAQILLYKKYFSELYNYPLDKIDVEFLILKRKAEPNEYTDFPKRIQLVRPADGKTKIKQAVNNINNFLNDCFDENGKIVQKEYNKNISKLCEYCIFNNTADCRK